MRIPRWVDRQDCELRSFGAWSSDHAPFLCAYGALPGFAVGVRRGTSPERASRSGRMARVFIALVALLATAASDPAADVSLLRQVVQSWLDERNRWAFTQFVREYDGERVKQERLEHYDPSRGSARRWKLISIDGQPPTEKQWAEWNRRKNKKPRRSRPDIAERFDFAHARVTEETAESVRYLLPLRSGVEWLFPVSKVELLITINKTGAAPALEQVQARISEPMRVALGLARILDIDLDVQMEPPPTPDPAEAKPTGTAQAVVTKFGERVEYVWSDFKRVEPHAAAEAGGG